MQALYARTEDGEKGKSVVDFKSWFKAFNSDPQAMQDHVLDGAVAVMTALGPDAKAAVADSTIVGTI